VQYTQTNNPILMTKQWFFCHFSSHPHYDRVESPEEEVHSSVHDRILKAIKCIARVAGTTNTQITKNRQRSQRIGDEISIWNEPPKWEYHNNFEKSLRRLPAVGGSVEMFKIEFWMPSLAVSSSMWRPAAAASSNSKSVNLNYAKNKIEVLMTTLCSWRHMIWHDGLHQITFITRHRT